MLYNADIRLSRDFDGASGRLRFPVLSERSNVCVSGAARPLRESVRVSGLMVTYDQMRNQRSLEELQHVLDYRSIGQKLQDQFNPQSLPLLIERFPSSYICPLSSPIMRYRG